MTQSNVPPACPAAIPWCATSFAIGRETFEEPLPMPPCKMIAFAGPAAIVRLVVAEVESWLIASAGLNVARLDEFLMDNAQKAP